jgi:HPt (histidine-containing phosphotransfer) domain-containing protein
VSEDAFREAMRQACEEYGAQLPQRMKEVRSRWRSGELGELRRALHSLAGSGKTFGFAGVSEAARAGETLLDPHCEGGTTPAPAERERLEVLLDELERATQAPPSL